MKSNRVEIVYIPYKLEVGGYFNSQLEVVLRPFIKQNVTEKNHKGFNRQRNCMKDLKKIIKRV